MLWLSLLTMFVCGFGMMQQMAASNTIIQTIVEESKRGRVMSFYTVAFVGMAPFGSLLAGGLAHAIGAPRTVMLSGAFCLAGAAWFATQLAISANTFGPSNRASVSCRRSTPSSRTASGADVSDFSPGSPVREDDTPGAVCWLVARSVASSIQKQLLRGCATERRDSFRQQIPHAPLRVGSE